MMITETEVVARFTQLNAQVLEHWIAVGWLKPHRDDDRFLFDDADIARTNLLCDLCYDMELRDEEMAMVLSLMDQLNGARSLLRAMTAAVHSQPNEIREAILTRVRLHLAPLTRIGIETASDPEIALGEPVAMVKTRWEESFVRTLDELALAFAWPSPGPGS